MTERSRTDLCGGRAERPVPTATKLSDDQKRDILGLIGSQSERKQEAGN